MVQSSPDHAEHMRLQVPARPPAGQTVGDPTRVVGGSDYPDEAPDRLVYGASFKVAPSGERLPPAVPRPLTPLPLRMLTRHTEPLQIRTAPMQPRIVLHAAAHPPSLRGLRLNL